VAHRIKLARGQRLNLGDRVHRALNGAGGHARVEDSHVRTEVGLHRVNQTERATQEKTTEKNPGGNLHKG